MCLINPISTYKSRSLMLSSICVIWVIISDLFRSEVCTALLFCIFTPSFYVPAEAGQSQTPSASSSMRSAIRTFNAFATRRSVCRDGFGRSLSIASRLLLATPDRADNSRSVTPCSARISRNLNFNLPPPSGDSILWFRPRYTAAKHIGARNQIITYNLSRFGGTKRYFPKFVSSAQIWHGKFVHNIIIAGGSPASGVL